MEKDHLTEALKMDSRNGNNLKWIAGGFPFLMLITAIFFQGFVFLLLNGPNIYYLAVRKLAIQDDLSFWYQRVLLPWSYFLGNEGRSISVWLLVIISLITGFILTPVVRAVYTVVVIITEWLTKKPQYSPFKLVKDSKYVPTLDWLFRNPEAKLCWEWQLLQVYVYWAALVSFGLFWFFSLISICNISIWEFLLYTILLAVYFVFVHYHSNLMNQLHSHYAKKVANDP